MFSGWQTFYELTGTAAAQLIGLLFIVVTLNRDQPQPGAEVGVSNGVKLFITPTVVDLGLVLIVSALALAPGVEHDSACAVMLACALAAAGYSVSIGLRIRRLNVLPDRSDALFYGVAPALLCTLLAGTCVVALARAEHAAYGVGLALLLVLVLAIRNAWDLVTWLSSRR